MSALTLQMFGVPAACQRLSPTDVEDLDAFAAAMVSPETVGFVGKDGLSDQVPLPDPVLLAAPQMILVGRLPPPAMPEQPQTPQVQIVEPANPASVASAYPAAEPHAAWLGRVQGAELGPQPNESPVAAMPSQALLPEGVPAAAGSPHFTLPDMPPSANTPEIPVVALAHAMSLSVPQQKRLGATQMSESHMGIKGLPDAPVALEQAFARNLPDISVSTAAPTKWRASGQADLFAVPVSDVEFDPSAHWPQEDAAHLQQIQAAPALAKTAPPASAKASAMPGEITAVGVVEVDLSQRSADSLMSEAAPDHPSVPPIPAQAVAAASLHAQPFMQDPAFASDKVTSMPQPAARLDAVQPTPVGKSSMAAPIAPEATATVQLHESTPDAPNLPEVTPLWVQKPAHPVQPIAVSSAESAWQTRLQWQHQPEAMRQVAQPALPPDPGAPQMGTGAIMAVLLSDVALALQPPVLLPRATAGDVPAPAVSRAAEATNLDKAKAIADPAEADVALADAKFAAAFVSGSETPRHAIRTVPGEAANPLVLSTVSAPKLAAQIVQLAQRAEAGPVEVLLHPEELGSVRFQIHQHGDFVRVVLCVERPETLDLVRRHADQLLQEFRQAGFSGATLSFGGWAQQGGQSDTPPKPPTITPPEDQFVIAPAAVRAATPSAAQYGGHGLNLRL